MKAQRAKTRSGCSTSSSYRRAFSLIELLVVVAVILILMGISLKVMSVVSSKAGVAKTLYVLEQTRNALDSYYSTMGVYPNTTYIQYDRLKDAGSYTFDIKPHVKEVLGLSYYLGFESHPRAASWQKFAMSVIAGVETYTNAPVYDGANKIISTNIVDSIRDAWGNDVVYTPNTNSDGYTLYSKGLDGKEGTTDDIGITKNE
jgi:prepilin-type N-terminal cleavage/methylation domain-containing protein